jgi:hypothetical protein
LRIPLADLFLVGAALSREFITPLNYPVYFLKVKILFYVLQEYYLKERERDSAHYV